MALSALAQAQVPAVNKAAELSARAEQIKSDSIRLNRDLLALEEETMFPPSTQLVVFVSLEGGKSFELDSVQVVIDGKPVASQIYSARELKALQRGGVQRLYLGNVAPGAHKLVAFFTGKGTHDRDNKRGLTVSFDKSAAAKFIELQVRDTSSRNEPEFGAKVWQ
jgi:hypothetical protein